MYRTGYTSRSIRSIMTICGVLCRKKDVDESSFGQSSLARVLNIFDLTALGVGSTLGVGIYVLAGEVSKSVAGPAIIVSFFLAAVASTFAGLCYAEFGARVPKAGSAYIYSYYSVGELVAFIIGWSLILEYVIGAASVARGISTYVDSLLDGKIRNVFLAFSPMEASFMSPYIDFFAFGLCIILASALAFGVRESTIMNNFLTFCNLSVVAFIIISGLFKADLQNWQLEKKDLPGPEAGEGGFAPFGLQGIIKGAALCFYGFIGFDCIATTGEEVKNPQRAIPLSILLSLMITFVAYFGVSSVLTLIWPYYLQDPDAPFPYVYSQIGWEAAKWFVSVGALFGMFSSLFGAMFPLPRIIYAMASDGLLFRVLGEVSPKTKTPVIGTAVAGLVTATMSALFNLQQLISLMALGTLLAYTIVAISVLILRYSPDFDDNYKEIGESTGLVSQCDCSGARGFFLNYFNCGVEIPTRLTKKIAVFNIILYSLSSVIMSLLMINLKDSNGVTRTPVLTFVCILGTIMLMVFLSMCSQPKAQKYLPFQMPLVPLLPCLSIFLNVYLMVVLDETTWIKLAVWMSAGLVPYLCWYYWKFCHGELGENSRYNISRVNNIKLNELVWKLVREKKILVDGYINEGFVNESKIDVREEAVPNKIFDNIHACTENVSEFTEINNNVIPDKTLEVEGRGSSAEVHTVVSEEEKDERMEESVIFDVETCKNSSSPPGDGQDVKVELKFSSQDKEPKPYNIDESVETSKHILEGSEIPIKRKIHHLEPDFVPKVKVTSFPDSSESSKITPRSKILQSDIRNKLNRILQEQALFIRERIRNSYSGNDSTIHTLSQERKAEDSAEGSNKYVDVKTLTKAEIMRNLQHFLHNGPPKQKFFMKPAFAGNGITDENEDSKEET